VADIAVCW